MKFYLTRKKAYEAGYNQAVEDILAKLKSSDFINEVIDETLEDSNIIEKPKNIIDYYLYN